jgi:hypothetical protein
MNFCVRFYCAKLRAFNFFSLLFCGRIEKCPKNSLENFQLKHQARAKAVSPYKIKSCFIINFHPRSLSPVPQRIYFVGQKLYRLYNKVLIYWTFPLRLKNPVELNQIETSRGDFDSRPRKGVRHVERRAQA